MMTKIISLRSALFSMITAPNVPNMITTGFLLYALTKVATAVAMAPAPPPPSEERQYLSPWEEWVAPLDPRPAKPSLSLQASSNELNLSWSPVAHAESYIIHANASDSGWQQVATIDDGGLFRRLSRQDNDLSHRIDYQSRGWDLNNLSLKLFACKNKSPLLLWALWDTEERCNQSKVVNVSALMPSILLITPAQDTRINASYTIQWTATSLLKSGAAISLYYDTDNSGYDGQLITGSLIEGVDTSYVWDSSSVTSGDYYLYAKIDDGVTSPAYDYSDGKITINKSPSITILNPSEDVTAYGSYVVSWAASDIEDQATIALYYADDNTGFNGTLIVDNLLEGTDSSYTWNVSALDERDYYLYAIIDDGINPPVYQYASGKVTIIHTLPHPLNDTGIDWGGNYPSGNNADCSGETISQQDCSHGRDAKARAGTLTKIGGGAAGFDFTRLNADGSEYTGSGNYASDPWACVRDNHTGLIWEVKTDDGGIHDKDNSYRWGGKTALSYGSGWGDYYSDWDTLVDGSNDSSFCGFNDWRVPTLVELKTIVHRGVNTSPAIDSNYFPNTTGSQYWTSTPYSNGLSFARVARFDDGRGGHAYRSYNYRVRLVRGVQ